MRYLIRHLSRIERQIGATGGCILISDFDGTLSLIAQIPDTARLGSGMEKILARCLKFFPVVIASGRSLEDIKNKVGLNGLIYAGNHGLEWQIGKKIHRDKMPRKTTQALAEIKRRIPKILFKYPGVILEDKKMATAIHYRMLGRGKIKKFKEEVKNISKSVLLNALSLTDDNKTFEFRPISGRAKRDFVNFIIKYLWREKKKRFLPIYIGDAKTDETVFKGVGGIITIRVGKDKKSSAKYYVHNQKQVGEFFTWLAKKSSKLNQHR